MKSASHRIVTVAIAGAFATLAFDVFGQALAPLAGQSKLAPVGLAGATLKAVFGANPAGAAYLLHFLTGLIAYPLGWLLIARPIWRTTLPGLPAAIPAAAYGVVLWAFALYGMAHLVAGMKPFLGWTNITWVALWGHILFALVAAQIIEVRLRAPTVKNHPAGVIA